MWLQDIPMPPSLNKSYPSNKQGRRFKSSDLQVWENDFKVWAMANKDLIHGVKAEFCRSNPKHVIGVHLLFFFEWSKVISKAGLPKKIDLDNRLKHVLDWLALVLGIDDCCFFQITAEKYPVLAPQANNRVDVLFQWHEVKWVTPCDTKN